MIIDLDTVARIEQLRLCYKIAHARLLDVPALARYHWLAAGCFVEEARTHAVDLRPEDTRILEVAVDELETGYFVMGWRPDKVGTLAVLIGAPEVMVRIDDIDQPVEVSGVCRHVEGWDDVANAWALGICEWACYEK